MNSPRTVRRRLAGYTLIEMLMAAAVRGIVLAVLVAGSVALQRSFAATLDYATGQNDQMRIMDYLAVDLRRALTITPDGANGVTLTLPDYYNSDGSVKSLTIISTMGWPSKKKKKKKNKHQNIITSQTASYDPASTVTVKYYLGNAGATGKDPTKFYREGTSLRTVANDVSDFQPSISDNGDFARVSVSFAPRFRFLKTSDGRTGTTCTETILFRNRE
jgi:hypothetical protein